MILLVRVITLYSKLQIVIATADCLPLHVFTMAPPLDPLPRLDQLPLRQGDPPNSAWGLWGDGPDSALGSLNYLSEQVVLKAAREEIRTGERVGLKYVSGYAMPSVPID